MEAMQLWLDFFTGSEFETNGWSYSIWSAHSGS